MSNYWKYPSDFNLSQEEIDQICENLWQERNNRPSKLCPDCGAEPCEQHEDGCDVARCTVCGIQAIQCYEHLDAPIETWSGLWPGIKECYEQKLIAYGSGGEGWVFDLNTYTVNKLKSK